MATLMEKAKDLEFVLGNKEWIMIKELCQAVDDLTRKINEPTYGSMIEDKED